MKKNSLFFPFFVAKRYVFSKKKHNVINIISLIAGIGVFASAMALIIILSVYNGMAKLVEGNFNRFNPDIEIVAKQGKSFFNDSLLIQEIKSINGIISVQEIVSDMTLITCNERQILATIKGVSNEYPKIAQLEEIAVVGDFELEGISGECAVLGAINAVQLGLTFNEIEMLKFHYPKRLQKNWTNPMEAFHALYLPAMAAFQSNTDYDGQIVFVPIAFARDLCEYHDELSSIEVFIADEDQLNEIQEKLKERVGEHFVVQNCYEQEAAVFKAVQMEKLVIIIILSFVILIAAFNIIGIVGMMLVEKKEDIEILSVLGCTQMAIRRIFAFHGLLVSTLAGVIGVAMGYLICFLQQTFELIKMGGNGNFIVSSYPVEMKLLDGVVVAAIVIAISLLATFVAVFRLKR